MPTTPPHFTDDTELPASDLNLIEDAILELQARADGTDYQAVQVTRATNQSITSSVTTAISFTAQVFDIGGWWSSGTDITVPAGAIPAGATTIAVRVIIQIRYATDSGGTRYAIAHLNGVEFGAQPDPNPATADATDVALVAVAPMCEAGDVITILARQTSGGALNVTRASATIERAGVSG